MTELVKVQLQSDFTDYYDEYLDKEGVVFERNRADELPRKTMYKTLAKHRLIPAVTGKVKKFRKKLPWEAPVIVFTDINRHDGGEKLLMTYKEAFLHYGKHEMSPLISTKEKENGWITYRYIRVGDAIFFFKLKSDSWNSNNGFEIVESERVPEEDALQFTPFDTPLYSIDFVHAIDGKGREWMFAVDLNFAPKLQGSGMEKLASGKEIADFIRLWYQENR